MRAAKSLNGKLLIGVLWLSLAGLWCQLSTVTAFAERPSSSQTSPAVAILDSTNTRYYFGLHYPSCSPSASYYLGADEYQRYFRGWEYVLLANNIPYTIVSDGDIENGRLDNFLLLILSNTVSLSDSEEHAIEHWVRSGGRLLATFGTGYKDVVTDIRQLDALKLQNGGTSGLHSLWHDPISKLVTSQLFAPGIDVHISSYAGPAAGLSGQLINNILPYGASANLLSSGNLANAYGYLIVPNYTKTAPAILLTDAGRGTVLYFAFAPEYLVSKEFNLPSTLPCPDGQNWTGRSTQLRILMRDAVLLLLSQ